MKISGRFCSLVFVAATLSAAQAQAGDWVLGAGLGTARYEDGAFDDADLLSTLTVGYRITPKLTLEGAYLDLGRVSDRILPPGSVSLAQDTLTVDASGLAVSAVWAFPVSDRWFVAGRLGVTVLDIDKQWTGGTVVDPVLAADRGGNENSPFYGISAGVTLSDRLSVSASWERFDVADIDVDGVYLKLALAF